MKVLALVEGHFLVDKEKNFTLLSDSAGLQGLRMAVQPFLVRREEEHILFDAGVGWVNDAGPVIFQRLTEAGSDRSLIDKIFLSHLHKDHINGLFYEVDGSFKCAYPNATIYLQRREFVFALAQEALPAYDIPMLHRLGALPNLHWMDEDQGLLNGYIRYQVTGGHSPYHQVFWIDGQDKIYFYGADNLPQRGYLDIDIAYKSDYDGRRAMTLRQEWKEEANMAHWTLLLYHDMKMPLWPL